MNWRRSSLFGSAVMAAILSLTATAFGDHHPSESALFPPAEWPNPSDPGVRGKIYNIPYYPGYYRPHDFGLFRFGKHGVCGFADWEWEFWPTTGTPKGDYGDYTGGPRDEAFLLHLGGNGPYRPTNGKPDIIDALQGGFDYK